MSPKAMKVADTRLVAVQALLYGSLSEVTVTVSPRTLRRWKAQYQAAELRAWLLNAKDQYTQYKR